METFVKVLQDLQLELNKINNSIEAKQAFIDYYKEEVKFEVRKWYKSVDKEWLIKVKEHTNKEIKHFVAINTKSGSYYADGFMPNESNYYNATLATQDEVKEALIKEAKKRFKEGVKLVNNGLSTSSDMSNGIVSHNRFAYESNIDNLWTNDSTNEWSLCLYSKGKWAEIITTPDITINGYKAKFHDNYVEFGCAKFHKIFMIEFYNTLDSANMNARTLSNTNREVTSVTLGEGKFTLAQLKEIKDYYQTK